MEKLFLVCNAHLDPVWLWEWTEGAAEALSTFRVAADFCEQYEGFVFNHNEALLYQWVEEYDPALFSRIQELVKQGKWHIIGGWYLQPDCVMLSGESFVRQITAGQSYFQEKFGARPTTAVNFDSFGHSKGLVQVLKRAGYDSYVVCRGGKLQENGVRGALGNDFLWEGLDGSTINVHLSDENYNSVYGHAAKELEDWAAAHAGEKTGLYLWGVGDHGGGPSRADLEDLNRFIQEHPALGVRHSTPEEYFAQLDSANLPLWRESLNPVAEGCYTSQVRVKQKHRRLENELSVCEKMLSNAAMQGLLAYPAEALDEARIDLMRAQFHDALPGSAIRPVEEATLDQLGHGLETVSRLKARAFFALSAGQKKVTPGETPILVYNPHPFPVKTIVDCGLVLPKQNWGSDYQLPLVYQDGKPLPCQSEKEASTFEIDWCKRAVFTAELAPASMNRFDCRFVSVPEKPPVQLRPEDGAVRFRSERLSVDINCSTGLVDSLLVDGVSMLRPGAFLPVVMNDVYNPWAVGYQSFDDRAGEFRLMTPEEGSEYSGLPGSNTPSVRVVEDGAVRTVVEALFRFGHSAICQRYFLPKEGTEIQVEIRLLWQEKDRMLKLCVPTLLEEGGYWGQTAFGREPLPHDGKEAVSHQWCALHSPGQNRTALCMNEGSYGSNCLDGEIRLSLVRSPGYSMSDCNGKIARKPGRLIERMDQGERFYRFWFDFGGNELLETADRRALIHNETPMALSCCPSGDGTLPQPGIEVEGEVVLSAFRRAEKGEAYILRLYEPQGRECTAGITLPALGIHAVLPFTPFEIKTLRLDPVGKTLADAEITE